MKPDFNLNDIPKENIFRAPENYFEQLPNRVMARCTQTPAPSFTGRLQVFWQQYRLAFASILILLGVFSLFFIKSPKTLQPQPVSYTALTEKEIVNYLLASDYLEPTDLAELRVADEDLTHYFLQATDQELQQQLETEDLEDLILL